MRKIPAKSVKKLEKLLKIFPEESENAMIASIKPSPIENAIIIRKEYQTLPIPIAKTKSASASMHGTSPARSPTIKAFLVFAVWQHVQLLG